MERPDELKEIVPQKRLADKVSGILSRIEAELDAVDEKIGERMHILDLDNDGLVSPHTWNQEPGFDGDNNAAESSCWYRTCVLCVRLTGPHIVVFFIKWCQW